MTNEEIFRNIKNPLTDDVIKEIIRRSTIPNYRGKIFNTFYDNMVITKPRDVPINVNESDKLKFTTTLFNTWKYNILSLTDATIQYNIQRNIYTDSIYKLINYLKSLPERVSIDDFYTIENDLIKYMGVDEIKKYGWRKTDGNYWTKVYIEDVVAKKASVEQPVHRLYINVNEKDLYKLAGLYMSKCYDKKVEYMFKFTTREKREDAIVFYATDKNLSKTLEILNEIKKEHPDIFERCENPPILTGKIDEKIGYGSEPTERICKQDDNLASFNLLRCKILEDAIKETARNWIMENSEKKTITYNNRNMLLGDYLVYRYAEARYREILETPPKNMTKEDVKKLEFQQKLLQEYKIKHKKYIITNDDKYFNLERLFSFPLPNNVDNLEKDILRNIISKDPKFIEKLKENIKKKCITYDIDSENFSMNIGLQKQKTFEEETNLLKQNIMKQMEEIYNEYVNNFQRENNENQLLSELSTIYQEFLYNIDKLIKEFNINDSIEKHKIEIKMKAKELYSKYYLKKQETKTINNIDDKKDTIPNLEELKRLKDKYQLLGKDLDNKVVVNRQTGKRETDLTIINNVQFAYLWLSSARIKNYVNSDEGYAFNSITEGTYKFFFDEVIKQIKETGTIDSIKLYRKAQIQDLNYKYSTEIITKLLASKSTIKIIENLLKDRNIIQNDAFENVEELYGDPLYASNIARNKDYDNTNIRTI